ncbi:hypothetical protein H5410_021673 [Solanum commersonii]|uniref:NADH-ubiquinone oxidoreductase chain 4 n=1 Tax=Solanum commersonii TaxID=4109 RepID=A0A9J5ZEX4_SOLCO|nr:hypothetical protein H5410_021673 [Solanum commersonii]
MYRYLRQDQSSWKELLYYWEPTSFYDFQYTCFPKRHFVSLLSFYTLSVIAIIYTSSTTLRKINLKKIIAYASVAHMDQVTIGMFSQAAAVRSPILSYGHTRPKHVGSNDNSKRHTCAASLPFKWPLARSSKEVLWLLRSTTLQSHELNFLAFPRTKRMGTVPWGIGGSILPMSSHGLVSSALFLCVGVLND